MDVNPNDEAVRQNLVAEYFKLCAEKGFDGVDAAKFRLEAGDDPELQQLMKSVEELTLQRAIILGHDPTLAEGLELESP